MKLLFAFFMTGSALAAAPFGSGRTAPSGDGASQSAAAPFGSGRTAPSGDGASQIAAAVPSLGPGSAVRFGPPAGYRLAKSASSVQLRGFVSSWLQDCADGCGLPAGAAKNDPVEAELGLPEVPGEFNKTGFTRRFEFKGFEGPLVLTATVYAICPRGQAQPPGSPCPGRYFQVQAALSGAAGALCGASLNEADAVPFPVLACGAPAGSKKIGITLHRIPL
ncbi:MAG: hypothetical protein HY922_09905 [Elusimicrobia bacterium]|nr:hypothetical protein [Elusimicrobiota bacterium]